MFRQLTGPKTSFIRGIVTGIAILLVARGCLNQTTVADWIVSPLLMDDSAQSSDAIVVLGAGVLDGCVPNKNGVRRVLLASRLWREGRAHRIVFTGGTGNDCPVAVAMSTLAKELGIPDSAIHVETASRNTWENGAIIAPVLRGWGLGHLLLVTDRLHMRRASEVYTGLGFTVSRASVPIGEAHDDNVDMLSAGLREFAALAYYRLRGWLGPAAASASPDTPLAMSPHTNIASKTGPIVILGASYAHGWNPGSIAGVALINRGVAGQQSSEYLERFDADVLAHKPRAVILWGFINDIFRAPPGDMEPALDRVRQNYAALIQRARDHGIEPVLATEVTTGARTQSIMDRVATIVGTLRGQQSYQDRINRQVMTINGWLLETGSRQGLLVLQFQSALSEPSGRRRQVFTQPDGSHITKAGYDVLTTYAAPILEEFVGAR